MIWLLLLALQIAPHGPEPGPRAALHGLSGFQSTSLLDFGDGQRNRLTAVYVFPDRARWHFENYDARIRSEHQFYYRHGETVREFVTGKPSREVARDQRDRILLQLELRRAVMLWPEGFAWQELEDGRRMAFVAADTCCPEQPLGSLVATLEKDLPVRVAAQRTTGEAIETLEIRAWQELGGRRWPRTLALVSKEGGFTETVESVETDVHFLELFFLPPDARPLRKPRSTAGPEVLSRDLIAMTYAEREFAEGVSWEEALERARGWIREAGSALESQGIEVDLVPTFELTSTARPRKCLVRLGSARAAPPPGYVTHLERAGVFLVLPNLESVDPAVLQRLDEAAPEGAQRQAPYLRVHSQPSMRIEVVLPLVP